MSFGGSPGDIIIVIDIARKLYRQCKAAGGEYIEVAREVGSLHTVLRHLKYEVEAPESLLNRDKAKYGAQLKPIIGNCDHILKQLDDILCKYGKLAGEKPPIWERIRFASSEMDSLNDIRMKLNNHKTTITVFLDTVQLHHGARVSTKLDNHGGQLDIILDKVDAIAERMGQRAGSVLTSYGSDDKEVWKEFRRELIAEGFSSDVLQRNKDVLRAYIREVDQEGLLTEAPPTPVSASQSVSPEWLESVIPGRLPAPEIPDIPSDEAMKEIVVNEENIKFPQSMKEQRATPISQDASRDIQHGMSALVIDTKKHNDYRVQPSKPERDGDNSSSDESHASSRNGSQVLIMRTRDITNPNKFLTADTNFLSAPESSRGPTSNYTRSGSPASMHSQSSNGSRSRSVVRSKSRIAGPSELKDYSRSPGRSEPKPITTTPRRSDEYSRSPRPGSFTLAPDSMGNRIPSDAKWTKIKRSLVCLEVLDEDGRRYEARPEYVAVLGVLGHEEIEELALRSKAIRESRRQPPREASIQRPARKAPQNFRYTRSKKSGDSVSSEESESDSASEPERRRHHLPKECRKRFSRSVVDDKKAYPHAPPTPDWPANLQPPPQSMWPPTSPPGWQSPVQHGYQYAFPPGTVQMTAGSSNPNMHPAFGYYPPPQPYNLPSPPLENRSHRSRRHGGSDRHQSQGRDIKKDAGRNGSRRWRDNLTAAGVGGAAVSLLSVLSEAAGEF